MTVDPYSAPPPSEEGEARTRPTVSWWAALDTEHARRVSPLCASIDAALRWAEAEVQEDEAVSVWEHTNTAGRVEDVRIWPEEEEGVRRDHLPILIRSLAEKLTDARRRRDLPSTGRKGSGHVSRPSTSMDATTRALTYDEVYDEDGAPRFTFGPTGWPELPEAK